MTLNVVTRTERRLATKPAEIFLPDDDDFPYGWRVVTEPLPDGRMAYRYIPLTQADFLDPQEGDRLIQSNIHVQQSVALYDMLTNRYLADSTVGVFMDMKMRWGIAGLKEPGPDVVVVFNLQDKEAVRPSFDVVKEGTRPSLIIEVVSPHYEGDDTTKVDIYEQAGIAEYIIVDPHTEDETMGYELQGYRLVDNKYRPLEPDEQGRLLSHTTGLWFGLDEHRQRVILTDTMTDERLLTAAEEKQARLAAEARVAELEARLRKLESRS